MNISELFPDEDYRFTLRFVRGEPASFFAASVHHAMLLAQRRHWLRAEAETYAALLPEGVPLLEEVTQLAGDWNGFEPGTADTPWDTCLALGGFWEADYLLLGRDHLDEFRLWGGCLCFPSSWRLSDKLRKPVEAIHAPVPGLNASIGAGIGKFLAGLKPGAASLRANWGLTRSPELNQYPDRHLPRLDSGVQLDAVWLRVEHQAFIALPESRGILFGIRIEQHPLAEMRADAKLMGRFCRALETMPEPVARYKGLAEARATILAQLRRQAAG